MSDRSAEQPAAPVEPVSIADVLAGLEPMGDLARYTIDDMTPEEEHEFFRILADT
jgi:hypothetical protein